MAAFARYKSELELHFARGSLQSGDSAVLQVLNEMEAHPAALSCLEASGVGELRDIWRDTVDADARFPTAVPGVQAPLW
jgi:hypothetical protein